MDTIRVWLEPEYDHGRTGAWMLDWPGAFTWGNSTAGAMARVTSTVNRFVEWLEEHGESAAPPIPTVAEAVDEVAAFRREDGYEVNATFDADRRAATTDELETAICRLAFAREDLLKLVDRVDRFESSGQHLALEERSREALADGAAEARVSDEVLRHIAGAETWFVSRLDRSARYEGPREPARDYLGSSRAFLVENLRRLCAEDPARETTDGKGEDWTLAKVFRRAIYRAEAVDALREGAEAFYERLGFARAASVFVKPRANRT
ncbi:MAG: hypothetical protein ABIP53_08840 [Candidatus Limnocylindrales bacterium]